MEGLCDDHFYKYIGIVGRFFSLLCPNLEDYNSEKNNVTWLKVKSFFNFMYLFIPIDYISVLIAKLLALIRYVKKF